MKHLLILFLLITTGLFAQTDKHAKIKALKVAHLTERLALTTAEAEKFWPVYNAYEDKMHDLWKTKRTHIYQKMKNNLEAMSNEEANQLIDHAMDLEMQELQNRKELIEDLRPVISPKKIILLRKAEEEFKKQLLENYRQRKNKK